MQKLTDLIEKRLNQHKLGDSAKASHIIHLANRFLYEKFKMGASEIRALVVKEGTLSIGTVSSVWSQEIWSYQETLLKKIRQECGEKSVVKILITGLSDK